MTEPTTQSRPASPPKHASLPQARLILRMWLSNNPGTPYSPGNSPSMDAIVRHGWARDTGVVHRYPNGSTAPLYHVTRGGLLAAAEALLLTPANLLP